MKTTTNYFRKVHLLVRLIIIGGFMVGVRFANKLDFLTKISPFSYLMPIVTGTLFIAYSIFPAGERGTSPIYQDKKRKKRQPIGLIDIVLFKAGIEFLLVGYFLQVVTEAAKLHK